MENSAFHARHELDDAGVTDILNKAIDDVIAEIAVGHLAAAEAQTRLYLVAVGEEAQGLILLGLVVVFIHGNRELDFFNGDDLLLFARRALALFLFVEIAAVVLNAADRRDGGGRNLDQVQAAFAGDA